MSHIPPKHACKLMLGHDENIHITERQMLYMYVPEIGGFSMQSLMASAVARMVREKSRTFVALLVSRRFFIH